MSGVKKSILFCAALILVFLSTISYAYVPGMRNTSAVYFSDKEAVEEQEQQSHFTFANLAAATEKHLVSFVDHIISTLHYSHYKLGGSKFDTSHGIYVVDCSNFVDHILQHVSPDAYSSLVNATGADSPSSSHYYDFFTELSNDPNGFWNKINSVEQLRAGDILVFRYKNSRHLETGGHVMVVMEKPVRDADVFFVRVADSAPSRHSQDTRSAHHGGIGIGTLLLKINPDTGRPSAYAWGLGSYWNKNVNFAMARPLENSVTTRA